MAGAAVLVGAAVTARRPVAQRTASEQLAVWQQLHDGIAPRGVVRGWLALVRLVSRPLARLGVRPSAVTLAGVWLAAAALVAADAGLSVPAALAVLLSALADGIDGCVAVLTRRESRTGARLDRLSDRAGEALWLAAVVLDGCPLLLAVAAGAAVLALEGRRAWLGRPPTVTVAERPTRVILVIAGLLTWPTAATAGLLALTLVGLVQLGRGGAGAAAAPR